MQALKTPAINDQRPPNTSFQTLTNHSARRRFPLLRRRGCSLWDSGRRNLCNTNRRRITRQNRIRAELRPELSEYSAFEIEVLTHGLYDHVHVAHGFEVVDGRDSRARFVCVVGLESPFGYVLGEELVYEREAFGDLVFGLVVEENWDFGTQGRYQGDAGAHLACAEDTQLLDSVHNRHRG